MQLSEKVHRLESTRGSYAYLVLGDEPVLIDTGFPGRARGILAELASLGLAPTDLAHVLLTHHDVDHIGNAKILQEQCGATVWAPAADVPYIHGDRARPGVKHLVDMLLRLPAPYVEHTYEVGQHIGPLEIIPAPGHTPGHTCLRMGDQLFAGDLVTTRGGHLGLLMDILTWDKALLKRSIREVGKLEFDWIYPAHGQPMQRTSVWDALSN